MAVTVKVIDTSVHGKLRETLAKLTFGTSDYTSGGYASGLSPQVFGMGNIVGAHVAGVAGQASGNVQFVWDGTTTPLQYPTSGKLIALRKAGSSPPAIIQDESVTITANAGRLANVPAYILAINASAGGTTGACSVVPTGSTLATTQCDVNFTTGAVKFFSTDAVTTALITYIPMGVGPFVPANQVIDETVALPNGTTVNLAGQAALVQYVYESTTLKAPLAIIGTQNSPAAGQVQIQLDNSGNTTITDNAAQNGKTGQCTYWKMTGFGSATAKGAAYGFVDRATTNASSSVINYASGMAAGDLNGTLINAYGVHHAALATNTDKPSLALGPAGTAAANSPVLNMMSNRITYAVADSITREFIAYILLNELFLNYTNEMPAGTNFASSTVYLRVFGTK